MKTKVWIALVAGILAVCLGLSLWLFRPGQRATAVRVISEGTVLYTLPLAVDREVIVETANGANTVTIRNGKVAVTEADCPDGHCMARGFCEGGVQIVCLPNRLVIEFTGRQVVDGIVG